MQRPSVPNPLCNIERGDDGNMKPIWILILTLATILGIAGCRAVPPTSTGPMGTPSTTTLPKPTATVPTTTAVPTVPPTTQTAVPTTAPQPTIGETCPPVEGDIYWGDFYGKGFKHSDGIYGEIPRIRLFADGTCWYQTSVYSNYAPSVYGTWTFDGTYLYIYDIEPDMYCTFLYVGAENPYESKLVYVKTEHEAEPFFRAPDGDEWIFDGIKRWE